MSSRKIKFGEKEVDKKEFYSSKQAISLDSVDLSKIVVSNKWKINDTTYIYLCGYLNTDVIQPLCVILPQMNGYIKYFDNGGKNISFVTDDEEVYKKYNEIWEVVRKLLKLNFTVGPIRDDKYIIAKSKIFNKINRTTFTDDTIPFEKNHYTCIPAIDIDSVLKIDIKRAYPQAYLEQCKYKLKKRKAINVIDNEIIDEELFSENNSYEEVSIKEKLRIMEIVLIDDAIIPTRASKRSAGLDLYSNVDVNIEVGSINKINTGICISLPENSYGSIRDKTSLAAKGLLTLGGVTDSDYTGEIIVIMTSLIEPIKIKKGQKVAQFLIF